MKAGRKFIKDRTIVKSETMSIVMTPGLKDKLQQRAERERQAPATLARIAVEKYLSIEEQKPRPLPDRAELDKIVFDALNLTEDELKEVYRVVYRLVWNRINKAQKK